MSHSPEFLETLQECENVRQLHVGMSKSPVDDFNEKFELERKILTLKDKGETYSDVLEKLGHEHIHRIRQHFCQREDFLIFPDLIENSSGLLVPKANSPENLEALITQRLKMKLRYNVIKERIYVNDRYVTDADLSCIRNECRRLSVSDAVNFTNDVVDELARKNSFDPAKDFIESKAWDGQDHISALFKTITIDPEFQENTDLYETFIKRWLIGVIAKIYKPGSQNVVLTFQGGQGVGKSRWLGRFDFGSQTHSEGQVDPSNKDHQLIHLNYVTWHLSELDSIVNKREAGELKDFITKDFVSARPAYGRFERTGQSRCSFCASVNDPKFLNDPTGSRRFLIIPVVALDHSHQIDMQQVFAQAKSLFDRGEQYWFDREEIDRINATNEAFSHTDWIDEIAAGLKPGDSELTANQILTSAGEKAPTRSQSTRLGMLLKKKGIESKRRERGGIKLTVYLVQKSGVPCK